MKALAYDLERRDKSHHARDAVKEVRVDLMVRSFSDGVAKISDDVEQLLAF